MVSPCRNDGSDGLACWLSEVMGMLANDLLSFFQQD